MDCHIEGKEWALSSLFADTEIVPTTDTGLRSAAAQQSLRRAGTTEEHLSGSFWNLRGPGELGDC